jgi:ketosteroid isomerase-like protein
MTEELRQQVIEVERAFARSMAERDFSAFTSFLSEEAVFMSPAPLHGKEKVAAQWQPLFEGPAAPFSWEPQLVEVLESGSLAISTGPVFAQDGSIVRTFYSIWRLEAPGKWRIIFDIGGPAIVQP